MPRESNWETDELDQIASDVKMGEELTHKLIMTKKKNHPSIFEWGIDLNIFNNDMNIAGDWRNEFREYLENPNKRVPHMTKAQAQKFVILERELYRKGFDGLLLKCLSFPNIMEVMKQVHGGVCGAHQSRVKMQWLIRRHDYFLSSILKDCITYSKGCQQC